MKEFDTKYMYDNKWTEISKEIFDLHDCESSKPYVKKVKDGILLPQRDGVLPWGIGGCIDINGELVDESTVYDAFGGIYAYDKNDVQKIKETVIYIPIIPKHWGHFLIDVVSRLWVFLDERFDTDNIQIFYNAFGWSNGEITGNYKKFLEYLGIYKRMKKIDSPIQASEVWIPSYTMSYSKTYNLEYKKVFEYVVNKVMNLPIVKEFEKYEKVYFSRTQLSTSRFKEIGEKNIEQVFRDNGYAILYPEKLSLEEQIFYFQTCKVICAMSGTIMHNICFANKNVKLFIMNRTCVSNPPQLMLNKLFDNDVVIVDTYVERTTKHPRDYGSGPFWISTNANFQKFCRDNQLTITSKIKPSLKEYAKYYFSLFYFGAKYNKVTIFLYYKMKQIISKGRN